MPKNIGVMGVVIRFVAKAHVQYVIEQRLAGDLIDYSDEIARGISHREPLHEMGSADARPEKPRYSSHIELV